MKKSIFTILMVAAAAITFNACSADNDITEPEISRNNSGIVFVTEAPEITNTRTQIGFDDAGGVIPLWTPNDSLWILCISEEYPEYPSFIKVFSESRNYERKTSFSTHDKYDVEEIISTPVATGFYGTNTSDVYPIYDGTMITGINTDDIQKASRNHYDPRSEVLVSMPMPHEQINAGGPITMRLKRLNSYIRLNLIDNTTGFTLNGTEVTMAEVKTTSRDMLYGNYGIDTAKGLITKPVVEGQEVQNAISVYGIEEKGIIYHNEIPYAEPVGRPFYTIGDAGQSIYISVLPATIAQGETFTVMFETLDGRTYQKDIILDSEVKFEDGKITTLNINVSDENYREDISSKSSYRIQDRTIYSFVEGSINDGVIKEALRNNSNGYIHSELNIAGAINNADLKAVSESLSGTDVDILDMSTASLNGATLATGAINIPGLQHLILPHNITTIESQSIPSTTLLTIPASVTSIADDAIVENNNPDGRIEIQMLNFLPGTETQFTASAFSKFTNASSCILCLNEAWKNDSRLNLAEKTWMGIKFMNIEFTSVDGEGNTCNRARYDFHDSYYSNSIRITSTAPGQILLSDLKRIEVKGSYTIKVMGDVNARDMSNLSYFIKTSMHKQATRITLDLIGAYLVSDASCNDLDVKIPADCVLPTGMISDMDMLGTLILPQTLKKIESGAIHNCPNIEMLEIRSDITEIGVNALSYDAVKPSTDFNVTFSVPQRDGLNFITDDPEVARKIILMIDGTWAERGTEIPDADNRMWKGLEFSNIYIN